MIFLLERKEFHRNSELETLFKRTKTCIRRDFTLTLPQSNYPFINTVDSFLTGIGCFLV